MEKLDISNSDLLENYSNAFGDNFKDALKNIEQTAKDAAKSTKDQLKAAGKNIEQTTKAAVKSTKEQTQAAGKNIKKTAEDIARNEELNKIARHLALTGNPAIAVPRSAALAGFRLNIFGLSSKLYPAFLDDTQLKKYNFDVDNAKKAKESWEKISKFWEQKLGGDVKKLKEAISGAWNKPIFRTKKAKSRKESTSGFDGYSYAADPYSAAAIGAYVSLGLTVLGAISKLATANKNPYAKGSPQADSFEAELATGDNTIPPVDEEELNETMSAARQEKNKKTYLVAGLSVAVLIIGGISAYFILRKK